MRHRLYIYAIGVALLSVVATRYILRPSNSDAGSGVSSREQEMQHEIDRLHQTISSLTAALSRINLNPAQPAGATPANNAAAPKQNMPQQTAAQPPASNPARMPDMSATGPHRPTITMVSPTPEQQAVYDNVMQRFDDPSFVRTLTMANLTHMEELSTLPQPLVMLILSKALEKYNNGEVDRSKFFPGGDRPQ